jgi:hypothetical protein
MWLIVTEELLILLIAEATVYKDELLAIFYQHAAHGPSAEVIGIGRVKLGPHGLRHYAKHGTTVQLEETRIYRM